MVRSTIIFVTDLPVAPTKPIDFGAFRFCHTCFKCADACPYEVISKDSAPSWEKHGEYNCSGAKKFFLRTDLCMVHRVASGQWPVVTTPPEKKKFPNGQPIPFLLAQALCDNCMASCVFNRMDLSSVHPTVMAIVANTPIFNGFFYQMDKAYGYGNLLDKDPEEWWDLGDEFPFGGVDTTVGCRCLK